MVELTSQKIKCIIYKKYDLKYALSGQLHMGSDNFDSCQSIPVHILIKAVMKCEIICLGK